MNPMNDQNSEQLVPRISKYRSSFLLCLSGIAFGLSLSACSEIDEPPRTDFGNAGTGSSPGPAEPEPSTSPTDPQTPDKNFGAPAGIGEYLFITNENTHRIIQVNSKTSAVKLYKSDLSPSKVIASDRGVAGVLDEGDIVLSLNHVSESISVLLFDKDQEGTSFDMNIGLSPSFAELLDDGKTLVVWRSKNSSDPFDGAQDIALVDLDERLSQTISVGFSPGWVHELSEQEIAIFCEDGVSIISRSEKKLLRHHNYSELPANNRIQASTAQVAGNIFYFRLSAGQNLSAMDLSDGTIIDTQFKLTSPPLLSADKKCLILSQGLLTSTGTGSASPPQTSYYRFDASAPGDWSSASSIIDIPGQVSHAAIDPSGGTLAGVHNIDGSFRLYRVSFDDLSSLSSREIPYARSDFRSSPQLNAFIAATKQNTSYGFAALDGELIRAPKLESFHGGFESQIWDIEDGAFGIITTPESSATNVVRWLSFPELQGDSLELDYPIFAAGYLSGSQLAFVADRHPNGRLTFIPSNGSEPFQLVGFEVASEIVK